MALAFVFLFHLSSEVFAEEPETSTLRGQKGLMHRRLWLILARGA